jgi:hypothetical protein
MRFPIMLRTTHETLMMDQEMALTGRIADVTIDKNKVSASLGFWKARAVYLGRLVAERNAFLKSGRRAAKANGKTYKEPWAKGPSPHNA